MKNPIARRDFLKTAGAVVTLATLGPRLFAAEEKPAAGRFKKAIMWGTVGGKGSVGEKMKAVKAAGFDGVEMMSHMDQAEVLKARDEAGLEIPSVCGEQHWTHAAVASRPQSARGRSGRICSKPCATPRPTARGRYCWCPGS